MSLFNGDEINYITGTHRLKWMARFRMLSCLKFRWSISDLPNSFKIAICHNFNATFTFGRRMPDFEGIVGPEKSCFARYIRSRVVMKVRVYKGKTTPISKKL